MKAGVVARVVIWNDFKVRYLCSNLLGLHLAKGFKVDGDTEERNVWNRLSRTNRNEIDLEFNTDNNGPGPEAYCDFEIGRRREQPSGS